MKGIIVFLLVWPALVMPAQQLLTLDEAVALALGQHPEIKAAMAELEVAEGLRKTAFSLPNPAVFAESPTGRFYTIGISQSLEFPGVYFSRSAELKASESVADANLQVTRQALIREVSLAFAEARYTASMQEWLMAQDSIMTTLTAIARRQSEAGLIDALSFTRAVLVSGEVHRQWLSMKVKAVAAMHRLTHSFLDSTGVYAVEVYGDNFRSAATIRMEGRSSLESLAERQSELAASRVTTAKYRMWPGLMLGYLNQGDRNAGAYYGWQAGITIPLWWWQYGGQLQAARAGREAAGFRQEAVAMEVHTLKQQLLEQYRQALADMAYYQQTALPASRSLADQSARFFESGQIDLLEHLGNLREVREVQERFIAAAYALDVTAAELEYIQH